MLFNFINAFACYKQKCKLTPFNLYNRQQRIISHAASNLRLCFKSIKIEFAAIEKSFLLSGWTSV